MGWRCKPYLSEINGILQNLQIPIKPSNRCDSSRNGYRKKKDSWWCVFSSDAISSDVFSSDAISCDSISSGVFSSYVFSSDVFSSDVFSFYAFPPDAFYFHFFTSCSDEASLVLPIHSALVTLLYQFSPSILSKHQLIAVVLHVHIYITLF